MDESFESSRAKFPSESDILAEPEPQPPRRHSHTLSLRFLTKKRASFISVNEMEKEPLSADSPRRLLSRPRFSSDANEDSRTQLAGLFDSSLDLTGHISSSSQQIERKFFIKIEYTNSEGHKEVKIFEVFNSSSIEELTKKVCKRFCQWEEWRYGLYDIQKNSWLSEGLAGDHGLKAMDVLQLRIRNAEYFSSSGENQEISSSRGNLLKSLNVFYKSPIESKLRKGGIYISMILFQSNGEILQTPTHMLPSIFIEKEEIPLDWESQSFVWIMKQWKDTEYDDVDVDDSTLTGFPKKFAEAAKKCKKQLFLKSLGHIYEEPVYIHHLEVTLIIGIAYISTPDAYLTKINSHRKTSLKWSKPEKLDPDYYDVNSNVLKNFMSIHEGRRNRLTPGLYVGLLFSQASPKGAKVIVPTNFKQMCPVMKVRENSWVSSTEWQFVVEKMKGLNLSELNYDTEIERVCAEENVPSESMVLFKSIASSMIRLKKATNLDWDMSHLYTPSTVPIDDSGKIQMISFVKVIGMEVDEPNYNKNSYTIYPLALFEIIHQDVYKSTTFNDFRRKSVKLERDIDNQEKAMKRSASLHIVNMDDAKLKENIQTLKREKEKWRNSSWVFTLIEWQRSNAWKSMYNKLSSQK